MTASPEASARRVWRYVAERPDGREVKGETVAASEAEALRLVQGLGIRPLDIRPVRAGSGLFSRRGASLKPAEAADLVRGIADLVTAGLPLKDALSTLSDRETRPALKGVLDRVEARLKGGDSLSAALRADPAGLPRSMIALAEAGEEGGLLGRNYTDLAEQMERDRALRQEMVGQLIYPGILLVVFFATLLFLSSFVLPQFESVFASARAEPPIETRIVLQVGDFIRTFGLWIPVALLALVIVARAVLNMLPGGAEGVVARIPLVGPLRFQAEAVRYCRVLGLLLSAGTPLARAEPVAREAIGLDGLRERHARAANAMRAGETLSSALSREKALPADALRLIGIGEKTGHLDAMLLRAAEHHEREVRAVLKRAVELIGPAMIVILAVCVGGVILAVMSGVLSLNDAVF